MEQQKKKIQAWLWSIPRTEISIQNLKDSLEELETRKASPPTWMTNPNPATFCGFDGSKQEKWVEFLDVYPGRKSFLEDNLRRQERKVKQYYDTLEQMIRVEASWGSLGAEIVKLKYYRRIKPDKVIYTMFLFCAERTFYQIHERALKFFNDVLPDVFDEKCSFHAVKR